MNILPHTIDSKGGNFGKVELERTLFTDDTKTHLNSDGKNETWWRQAR